MIFFLDENFPKKAKSILIKEGYSVFDIRGTDKQGLADKELFRIVKQKKAILLTTDKDFYHTIHLTEKPHYGIIVIALKKPDSKSLLEKLNWVLENLSLFSFKNQCLLINDKKCSIFS